MHAAHAAQAVAPDTTTPQGVYCARGPMTSGSFGV